MESFECTGVLDFIPLMRISYNWVPSRIFGLLGYQMFAFLFNWTDANWVREKALARLSARSYPAGADRQSAHRTAAGPQSEEVLLHAVARLVRVRLLVDWLQRASSLLLQEPLR